MTGVALAVVFGPNIFRCSDTLQGLQDQACVNAITCKLIEQYEYLFSTDGKDSEGNNKDQTDAGSLSDRSPRIKPARPPPPKFSQSVQLPSKMRSDENSNTVEGSNANKYLSKSLDDSLTGSQIKVPRIETNGGPPVNEHQGRKKYNRSVTINTELSRSLSPQKAPRPSSGLPIASPSSKQIVDTTIRDSVKEHLFGMGLVTSSSESDNQGLETMNSPEDGPAAGETQQPIRDVLKRFTAEKLSGATFKPSDVRKLSPKTRKNENMPEATKTIRSNPRPLSFPTNEIAGTVSADSLAMMKDQWTGTLTSLTLHRAPPPRTRRQRRRLTNTRSENVEELLRNQNNELINDNELGNEEPNATKTNQSNTTWPPNPLTKNAQKIIDNPLLVKIRNDKYSKPRSSSDESSGTNQASILVQQEIGKGKSRDRTTSPRKTVAKIAAKKPEAASGMTEIDAKSEENESADKPVIPPLDLYRVHQDDFEGLLLRFLLWFLDTFVFACTNKQKHDFRQKKDFLSDVLADSPIRSPRYFPSGGDERMHNAHKEQIFLEKKQDTVPILDMSAKDLKKRIECKCSRSSYFNIQQPKASEKAQVQKYVAELGRARKQLREVLSSIKGQIFIIYATRYHITPCLSAIDAGFVRNRDENPDRADSTQTGSEIGFAPNLRDIISKDSQPTKEDTLHLLLKKLQDKRGAAGRPEEIEVMSTDQLKDEKLAVQKALLQFENLHGRPITKDDKALMRPIYERYRRIKRMIATGKEPSSTKGKDTSDGNLARLRESVDMSSSKDLKFTAEGMPLHETAENSNVNKGGNVDASKYDDLNDTFNITRKPEDLQTSKTNADVGTVIISSLSQRSSGQTMSEAVLHDATLEELVQQQKMAKRSKKTLGKTLKDYEDEFFAENGRCVPCG
eukprot:gene16922-18629_t